MPTATCGATAVPRFSWVNRFSEDPCEPGAHCWGSSGRRFKSCQPDVCKPALNSGFASEFTFPQGSEVGPGTNLGPVGRP